MDTRLAHGGVGDLKWLAIGLAAAQLCQRAGRRLHHSLKLTTVTPDTAAHRTLVDNRAVLFRLYQFGPVNRAMPIIHGDKFGPKTGVGPSKLLKLDRINIW